VNYEAILPLADDMRGRRGNRDSPIPWSEESWRLLICFPAGNRRQAKPTPRAGGRHQCRRCSTEMPVSSICDRFDVTLVLLAKATGRVCLLAMDSGSSRQ